MFWWAIVVADGVTIIRSDCGRNPKELADSAGEKNGEKKAVDESVWKRVGGWWLGVGGWWFWEGARRSAHGLWHVEQ